MPCYTANLMTVEFRAENRKLLDSAIAALGWTQRPYGADIRVYWNTFGDSITIDLANGTAQVESQYQSKLNQLKRAYSAQVLSLATKQKGWILRTTDETNGQIVRY